MDAATVTGPAIVLDAPLCFLVVDPETGVINDPDHPQKGQGITGGILVMPGARGGGVTPSQLCDAIRNGVGPLAIVLPQPDPAITAGCLVAERLYGQRVPVIVVDEKDYGTLRTGDDLSIDGRGCLRNQRTRVGNVP